MRRAGWLPLALILLGAVPAIAQPPPPPRRFAQGWQDYSPGERYEALRNYQRHSEKPEKRQRRVEERYQRYQQMPQEERDRIRQNYDRYRNMPPGERQELQNRYKTWKKDSKR
jgi:hypothetical protein